MVINCAAWTDVDGAEEAEAEAMAVNGTGAGNLAAAADAVGASVVYVSSDYVFDGTKGAPYVESDQPAPLSAYGRTKLAGEEATAAANPRHFVVRSSWLFGTAAPTSSRRCCGWRRTTARSWSSATRSARRPTPGTSPTGSSAWSRASSTASTTWRPPVPAPGTSSPARSSSRPRVECKVLSATTDMLGRPAPRPPYSALASQREHAIGLPPWQDGLAGYLAQRGLG